MSDSAGSEPEISDSGSTVESLRERWPKWLRDLDQSLSVRSQFVLWGNVRDLYLMPDGAETVYLPLVDTVWEALSASDYEFLLLFDPIDGVSCWPASAVGSAGALIGVDLSKGPVARSIDKLRDDLRAVVDARGVRAAVVLDYASRLVSDPQHLTESERRFYAFCEKLSHTATPLMAGVHRRVPLHNPVIWVLNREGDVPDWFLGGNDDMRSIAVPLPELGARHTVASQMTEQFTDATELSDEQRAKLVKAFSGGTDGLTLSSMVEITQLAHDRGWPFAEIEDAVRAYKVGIVDNPWSQDYVRDRLSRGEQDVRARVIGQDEAITEAFDILKRSVMGLSGAQAAGASSRPRGVLFFAGPTGVGKTELAKQITQMIFGDTDAYIRFDMSEFSAEQSDLRLIGAPPSYVGFEAGGELTNAVRQRPFSLILFDEIEKGNPRILDKFLQILEDGRLTDGRGTTTHFSESILVFTSNLGVNVRGDDGKLHPNVTADMAYPDVRDRIEEAIRDHFKLELNRPELLNRLGDNIVVFNFIRPDVAEKIFDLQLGNVVERIRNEHKAALTLVPSARETLLAAATSDLSNGGRGIGSALETALVNPLARALFHRGVEPGEQLEITAIQRVDNLFSVTIA